MDGTEKQEAPAAVQQNLTCEGLFADFERDGYYFNHPVANTAGLYRSMGVGDCLYPILAPGDMCHIEMGARPEHGDIVMFEWSQEVQKSWETDPRRAECIAKFGNTDFSRGMKLFWRWPAGVPELFQDSYLIANDGLRKAKDHKILGVLRAVERNGVLLQGDIVHRPVALASIDPNAATDLMEASSASSTSTSGALGLVVNVLTLTVPNLPFDCTLILTATGRVWTSAANTWLVYIGLGGITIAGSNTTSVAAPGETIAYRGNWFVPGSSGAKTFTFSWQTTGVGTINGTGLHFQVEIIKK